MPPLQIFSRLSPCKLANPVLSPGDPATPTHPTPTSARLAAQELIYCRATLLLETFRLSSPDPDEPTPPRYNRRPLPRSSLYIIARLALGVKDCCTG
jgi:hypothetical protein